ncbi:MAG TPA: hypothetical protein PKW95_09450 [bacterium]|nr:hypothetical protein [bacterium]
MEWKNHRLPIVVLMVILSMALMGAQGCNGDDDDDSIDDDASPADDDNDTFTPDDDSDDDDTVVDDDVDDDATPDDDVDDDIDDDTTPSAEDRLVLLGSTADGYAAWTQTDDGWQRQVIPAPTVDEETSLLRGPVLIRDGSYGYSLWNIFHGVDGLGGFSYTMGNQWLAYDRQTGWRAAEELAPAQARRFVKWIGLPADDTLWASANLLLYVSIPMQPPLYYDNVQLLHYDAAQPQVVFDGNESGFYAIDIPTATAGLMQMYVDDEKLMMVYDGEQWSPYTLPAGFEDIRVFDLNLDASLDGYATYNRDDKRWVGKIEDGVWTQQPIPAQCLLPERFYPQYLARHGGHVVAYYAYKDTRFLEKRDGQWYCRSFETEYGDLYVRNAIAYTGEVVYVSLDREWHEFGGRVLRFDPDGYEDLILPTEMEHLWGLYMTGPTAPPRQYLKGEMYILY